MLQHRVPVAVPAPRVLLLTASGPGRRTLSAPRRLSPADPRKPAGCTQASQPSRAVRTGSEGRATGQPPSPSAAGRHQVHGQPRSGRLGVAAQRREGRRHPPALQPRDRGLRRAEPPGKLHLRQLRRRLPVSHPFAR